MPAPNVVDKDLAASDVAGSFTPMSIWAGEQDIVTDTALVAPSTTLTKLQVVAFDTSGHLVALNPAATDSTKIPVGVISQGVTTGSTPVSIGYYIGGFFNFAALTWPGSITTLAAAKAIFRTAPSGVNINIGTVGL